MSGLTSNAPQKALQMNFDKAIQKAMKKYHIEITNLTEQQTAEVFKQAILSGDIMKHVTQDHDKQAMSYVPYRQQQMLKDRIAALEKELAETRGLKAEGGGLIIDDGNNGGPGL